MRLAAERDKGRHPFRDGVSEAAISAEIDALQLMLPRVSRDEARRRVAAKRAARQAQAEGGIDPAVF